VLFKSLRLLGWHPYVHIKAAAGGIRRCSSSDSASCKPLQVERMRPPPLSAAATTTHPTHHTAPGPGTPGGGSASHTPHCCHPTTPKPGTPMGAPHTTHLAAAAATPLHPSQAPRREQRTPHTLQLQLPPHHTQARHPDGSSTRHTPCSCSYHPTTPKPGPPTGAAHATHLAPHATPLHLSWAHPAGAAYASRLVAATPNIF